MPYEDPWKQRRRQASAGSVVLSLVALASSALAAGQPAKTSLETSRAVPSPFADSESHAPIAIDPPAATGSILPALATENVTTLRRKHDVLMTWLEPSEPGWSLKFSRFTGEEWTRPVTIADGVGVLDPADPPSLIVFDTQAVRRTLIARAGDIVARSGDAGRTWGRLPTPALPFSSFAGGEEGGYAFWLDPQANGTARLLGTRILAGEELLDPHAAGTSGTSAAMTWDGPVVVYRDGSAEGAQDILLVRRQDARWTRPRPVHHVAGWRIAERPVSSPEVAVLRRLLAVAWYTEVPHRPRVLVGFSEDGGNSFGAPIEVDLKQGERTPLPIVDVDLDENGDALVLWQATTGPAVADLKLARVSSGGQRGQEVILATALPAGSAGIPQVVRAGDFAAVAWIEDSTERLRVTAVPSAGIPAPGTRRTGSQIADGSGKVEGDSRQEPKAELAPDFSLLSLDGEEVSLPGLSGSAVLLNLWATWCLPCIAEMPEIAELEERYASEGLAVVGLSVDTADAEDRVRSFVAKREIPFTVWLDPEMSVYKALRVKTLPVTLIIDREGRIVARRDGAITADDPEILAAIKRALKGP